MRSPANVAAGLLLLDPSGHWLWFVIVAPALAIVVFFVWAFNGVGACGRFRTTGFARYGADVHSDSRCGGSTYRRWLSRLEGVACTLNWSERASW